MHVTVAYACASTHTLQNKCADQYHTGLRDIRTHENTKNTPTKGNKEERIRLLDHRSHLHQGMKGVDSLEAVGSYIYLSIYARVFPVMGLGSTFLIVAESPLTDVFSVHEVLVLQLSCLASFLSEGHFHSWAYTTQLPFLLITASRLYIQRNW